MPESVKAKSKVVKANQDHPSDDNGKRRSGLLEGREEIRKFLGVSDYALKRFIAAGMPVLIEGTRWLAHEDNLEDFFRKYTRVDSRSKADEILCQVK